MPIFVEHSSDRLRSRLLHANQVRREIFDPANAEHRASYLTFVETGVWGSVQFFHEFPFETVPATVAHKFAVHALRELAAPAPALQ
jgi:hypothetical protein